MTKLDDDILEVGAFLNDLRYSKSSFQKEQNTTTLKATYKQFHSLLVWNLISESQQNSTLSPKIFFRETLSDISHSLLLTLLHIYKPARACLRSGIENHLRSLLLIKKHDASKINNVYDLFKSARKEFQKDSTVKKNIDRLSDYYDELCKTVHSAKIDYMALTVPFETIPTFNTHRFGANLSMIKSVCSLSNQSIFWLWHNQLSKVGPANSDLVRDSIPKNIKRAAIAAE